MPPSGDGQTAPSLPEKQPEFCATSPSRAGVSVDSALLRASVQAEAVKGSTTVKPSSALEAHPCSARGPADMGSERPPCKYVNSWEEVLPMSHLQGAIHNVDVVFPLAHSQHVCVADEDLSSMGTLPLQFDASPAVAALAPSLVSQLSEESLHSSDGADAISSLSYDTNRRESPRGSTSGSCFSRRPSGGSSTFTMAPLSSPNLRTNSVTSSVPHSHTNSLTYYSAHCSKEGKFGSVEIEAASRSNMGSFASLSFPQASWKTAPLPRTSSPADFRATQRSLALSKPREGEAFRSEGTGGLFSAAHRGAVASVLFEKAASTKGGGDSAPPRAVVKEGEDFLPPHSTLTSLPPTASPIVTAPMPSPGVNASGGAVPNVPAIRLPSVSSIPVSDSERGLASIPALGYGPRSTPNACSITSSRSGRSLRSARHSHRHTKTLRNNIPNLKELFPSLPDDLYVSRDRLCISQEGKRQLGCGAYGTVQQAELYPPTADLPRVFTPTTESLTSPSLSSSPRFSPANGYACNSSFSFDTAVIGSSGHMVGASSGGYSGIEQTGRAESIALVPDTSCDTRWPSTPLLSNEVVSASTLPLHQQPYSEQTASFYNGFDGMMGWRRAVQSVHNSSWGPEPSSQDDGTSNRTASQAKVAVATPHSQVAPDCASMTSGAHEGQQGGFYLSLPERSSSCKPTTAISKGSTSEMQSEYPPPVISGKLSLSGLKSRLSVSSTPAPVSPVDVLGGDHAAAAVVGNADNRVVRRGLCDEGTDGTASLFSALHPARWKGEALEEGCIYCTHRTLRGHGVAGERGGGGDGSGAFANLSSTSSTGRGDFLDTALAPSVEGKPTSCGETAVPQLSVHVDVHSTLCQVMALGPSANSEDIGALDHAVPPERVSAAGYCPVDTELMTADSCSANKLLDAQLEEDSRGCLQPAVVGSIRAIHVTSSGSPNTSALGTTQSFMSGKRGKQRGNTPPVTMSPAPCSKGSEARQQGPLVDPRRGRDSCPGGTNYLKAPFLCDGTGSETSTVVAHKAMWQTQERCHHCVRQPPGEMRRSPREGVLRERGGHGSRSARPGMSDDTLYGGGAVTKTATCVDWEVEGEALLVAEPVTPLRVGALSLPPSPSANSAKLNCGSSFSLCTRGTGSVADGTICGGGTAPSFTSSVRAENTATLTGAVDVASARSLFSRAESGQLSAGLLGDTTNPLQMSLDSLRTSIAGCGVHSSMATEMLTNGAPRFRSVAIKVVEKEDLVCSSLKLDAFHNELRMASRLDHPCLVKTFGVAEDAENFYLVMDLAEKGNLAQYQQQFGVMRTREMAPRFIADIVCALEYLGDGSQHSYLMTPSTQCTGHLSPHNNRCSTSVTAEIKRDAETAVATATQGFPDSASMGSPHPVHEGAVAATLPKQLVMQTSLACMQPQLSGASAIDLRASVCSGTSAKGSTCQNPMRGLSECPFFTSSVAVGPGRQVPACPLVIHTPRGYDATVDMSRDSIVVHRDLKPENLLLTRDLHVKLADFGDACFYGDDEANKFGGTPSYISPEVVTRCKASPYSDLWALGCVLYELLVGQRLFSGSLADVGDALRNFEPEALEFPELMSPMPANAFMLRDGGVQERGGWASACISEAAKDLVRQLLQPVPENRIGSAERGGFEVLKEHPFFAEICWDMMLQTASVASTSSYYMAALAEYLGPAEAVVHCSLVRVSPTFEGSNIESYTGTTNDSSGGGSACASGIQEAFLMVLTDAPRLFSVNLDLAVIHLEIPWCADLRVRMLCDEHFTIAVPMSSALAAFSTSPSEGLPTTITSGGCPGQRCDSPDTAKQTVATYIIADLEGRADLWCAKIEHMQSARSASAEVCCVAEAKMPCLHPASVAPIAAGTPHWLWFNDSYQQQCQQYQQCRGAPVLSPRAGIGLLHQLRNTHVVSSELSEHIMSSRDHYTCGSLDHAQDTKALDHRSERFTCADGGVLSGRMPPAAPGHGTAVGCSTSVAPVCDFPESRRLGVPISNMRGVMHQSPGLAASLPSTGAALRCGGHQFRTTAPEVSSSSSNKPRRRSTDAATASLGASGRESLHSFGLTKTPTWMQSAAPPPPCRTTSTSASTTGVSPCSTFEVSLGSEKSSHFA